MQDCRMSEQLSFSDMPRRLFRATPSRLTTWLDCPRRYRFTYLERPTPPKGPPWAHNSVGASVHTALASWWRLPVEQRTPAHAGDLLEQGWLTNGFRDDAQCAAWRSFARELVSEYVKELDPNDEPVGVERTVAVRTPGLALSGRIDRLDERPAGAPDGDAGAPDDGSVPPGGTELCVVDYKTGRRTLTTADVRGSLALAVYAVAAEQTLRRPCRRVELHHLPSATVVAWDHSPDGLRRHLDRAEAIGAEAAAAEEVFRERGTDQASLDAVFPPQPGPQCQWCDFSSSCPEGRNAYPTKRPWDALDSAVA